MSRNECKQPENAVLSTNAHCCNTIAFLAFFMSILYANTSCLTCLTQILSSPGTLVYFEGFF